MFNVIEINSYSYHTDKAFIKFPVKAREVILLPNKVIALLVFNQTKDLNHYWSPFWCYDLEGHLLWKVERPVATHAMTGQSIDSCLFIGIYYHQHKKSLHAYSGVRIYDLDSEIGKLSNERIND